MATKLAPSIISCADTGDDAPSFATFMRRATEFKTGRESLKDDPRSGRLPTKENVDIMHDMIMDD